MWNCRFLFLFGVEKKDFFSHFYGKHLNIFEQKVAINQFSCLINALIRCPSDEHKAFSTDCISHMLFNGMCVAYGEIRFFLPLPFSDSPENFVVILLSEVWIAIKWQKVTLSRRSNTKKNSDRFCFGSLHHILEKHIEFHNFNDNSL